MTIRTPDNEIERYDNLFLELRVANPRDRTSRCRILFDRVVPSVSHWSLFCPPALYDLEGILNLLASDSCLSFKVWTVMVFIYRDGWVSAAAIPST